FHMGAARAGSLQAHFSIRSTADDLVHLINKVEAEAVFVAAALLATLRAAWPRAPSLKTVIVIGTPPGPLAGGEIGWGAFPAPARDAPPRGASQPADPVRLTLPRGTTGRPHGRV